jgi:flagellar hook protein FlgE
MALLNSFNSGVAGIKTFGKSLEVIGDNIANVNSTGFKGSRVTNQDNFSLTFQEASPAGGGGGGGGGAATGSNSMQVGTGSSVASITQQFTQGALSTTGGPTDLGISGKGFFKVVDGQGTEFYTRAGDFMLDNAGNLLTNGGLNVQGTDGNIVITTPETLASLKVNKDGTIDIARQNGTIEKAVATVALFNFANPNGLKREGDNLLSNFTEAAGAETAAPPGTSDIIQGTLELSNVDLTQQFSDLIVAQRAFQANSRVITVSDSVMDEIVNLKR